MERNDNSTADPLDELVTALASTTDKQLIREFLQSILTPSEIEEIPKRWALVRLIDEGWSQRKIAAELGLSLCKITRGSRELKKENSAFRRMVNRYKEVASRNR
jgi:TrpR family trp operon transcriptional repressor